MACALPRPFKTLDIFVLSIRNVIEGITLSVICSEVSKGKVFSTLPVAKKMFNTNSRDSAIGLNYSRIGHTNNLVFESTVRGFVILVFLRLVMLLANEHAEGQEFTLPT